MTFKVEYKGEVPPGADFILAPGGLATPHGIHVETRVAGGTAADLMELTTGQTALVITPDAPSISVAYTFDEARTAPYPGSMFEERASRFTRFAEELAAEAKDAADGHKGLDRARAIACAAAERFTYGHPEERFNDGFDEIPALGCGVVEGSCVDINTYFIAALRAAGIEAGYVTGFFFPEEKQGLCEDGHCWVVTRISGETREWDIAHHLKMGTRAIEPGLNPKPGFRAATFHSMGLRFAGREDDEIKALIEPIIVAGDMQLHFDAPQIRLLIDEPECSGATA